MFRLAAYAAIALIPASTLAVAAAEAALDGWGNYKLGMTTDQARALPGVSLSSPKLGEFFGTRFVEMKSLGTVAFDGRRYALSLFFTPQERVGRDGRQLRLAWIDLINERTSMSPAECEKTFQIVLRNLEKQYGALLPPSRDPFDPLNATPITEEFKDSPDAVSKYVLMTFEPSRGYAIQAMKVVDAASVAIEATGTPDLNCSLRIRYAAQ
jgi:hypothetical protein